METWLIILIITVGLISIAALGLGLYFLFRPKTSSGGGSDSGGDDGGGNNNSGGGNSNGGGSNGGGSSGNGGGKKNPPTLCGQILDQLRNPGANQMNLSKKDLQGLISGANQLCCPSSQCDMDSMSALWMYNLVVTGQYDASGGKDGVGGFVGTNQGTFSSNAMSAALNALNTSKNPVNNQNVLNSILNDFWSKTTYNGADMTSTINNFLSKPGKFDLTAEGCSCAQPSTNFRTWRRR